MYNLLGIYNLVPKIHSNKTLLWKRKHFSNSTLPCLTFAQRFGSSSERTSQIEEACKLNNNKKLNLTHKFLIMNCKIKFIIYLLSTMVISVRPSGKRVTRRGLSCCTSGSVEAAASSSTSGADCERGGLCPRGGIWWVSASTTRRMCTTSTHICKYK